MTSLTLSKMGIENIEHDAFDGMESLTELDLNDNRLASIQPGTFSGLKSLQIIKLKRKCIGIN